MRLASLAVTALCLLPAANASDLEDLFGTPYAGLTCADLEAMSGTMYPTLILFWFDGVRAHRVGEDRISCFMFAAPENQPNVCAGTPDRTLTAVYGSLADRLPMARVDECRAFQEDLTPAAPAEATCRDVGAFPGAEVFGAEYRVELLAYWLGGYTAAHDGVAESQPFDPDQEASSHGRGQALLRTCRAGGNARLVDVLAPGVVWPGGSD